MPKMSPAKICELLERFPHEVEITEWADGKGCNVVVFPDFLARHNKAMSERGGAGPMVLFCSECHARSGFIGGSSPERYWQIPTRHGVIWAYNREHLVEIRDHIQLERRPQGFIKLPGWMVAGKNRDEIVKLINRALEHGLTGG